jgi:hypothetical protein
LAIFHRLNYLDRQYQYTPALLAYQLTRLSKAVADLFIMRAIAPGLFGVVPC